MQAPVDMRGPRRADAEPARAGAGPLRVLGRALRVHQWLKNLLVFVPVAAAHRFGDTAAWGRTAVLFLALSCAASSAYVVNDLIDEPHDRRHPVKRWRPVAAGTLSRRAASGIALGAAVLAASLAALLPPLPVVILAAYVVAGLAYSLWLKRLLMVDVIVLAMLYSIRLFAGAETAGVAVSRWLLAFSTFLFFGLALLKRYSELPRTDGADAPGYGRGYLPADRETIHMLGVASTCTSVLVLVLYLDSPDVSRIYTHATRLWLLVPVMLYWVSRLWLLARRGVIDGDPVVFTLRDPVSWTVGAATLAVVALAT